jgi:hypothetical protein
MASCARPLPLRSPVFLLQSLAFTVKAQRGEKFLIREILVYWGILAEVATRPALARFKAKPRRPNYLINPHLQSHSTRKIAVRIEELIDRRKVIVARHDPGLGIEAAGRPGRCHFFALADIFRSFITADGQ